MPWRLGEELQASLRRPGRVERVTLALAGWFWSGSTPVLVPFALRPVPDDQYTAASGCGAAFSHRFIVAVWNEAVEAGVGLLLFHSHGGRERPSLSSVDRKSFERLASSFSQTFPHLPFGSVVLSDGRWLGGSVRLPGEHGPSRIDSARWFLPELHRAPALARHAPESRYGRHDDVWGSEGQSRLANATVGVIGAGGGGGHVIQQLAHAGLGRLVIVDADVLEDGNRSRVVGGSRADLGRPKARLLERVARHANEHIQVETVQEWFPSEPATRALRSADILVACVDTLQARDGIQQFAWRHALPLVDIGLSIHPRRSEAPLRIGGHVAVAIPGGPCLWCMGLLSRAKLDEESGGRGPAYVTGGGQAQVISFNGVLASAAVNEVLDVLTGFRGRNEPPGRLVFNGMSGALEECVTTADVGCEVCRGQLGRGSPAWVPVRPVGPDPCAPSLWNRALKPLGFATRS